MCAYYIGPQGILDVAGITFDAAYGIGATKLHWLAEESAEVIVWMRPAIFLQLATPMAVPRPSLVWIKSQIAAGAAISPPMLKIWLSQANNGIAAVVGHNGRHRCIALRDVLGDAAVPIRLELVDVSEDVVSEPLLRDLQQQMRGQGGDRRVVPGPLFTFGQPA
jgi:hypothetical protein